jgi:hypothetical protein
VSIRQWFGGMSVMKFRRMSVKQFLEEISVRQWFRRNAFKGSGFKKCL